LRNATTIEWSTGLGLSLDFAGFSLDKVWTLLGQELGFFGLGLDWINIVLVWIGSGFIIQLSLMGWDWVWTKTRPVAGLGPSSRLHDWKVRHIES
jgi:hypothetical protein